VQLAAMMAMFMSKFKFIIPYRLMMNQARTSKLNNFDKLPGFEEHIKPFLAAKL
jgi:hypothetical protein